MTGFFQWEVPPREARLQDAVQRTMPRSLVAMKSAR